MLCYKGTRENCLIPNKQTHFNESIMFSWLFISFYNNEVMARPPPPPPSPWGEGGHLDLLWLPVTQMCVCVCICTCARLCLRDIYFIFIFHGHRGLFQTLLCLCNISGSLPMMAFKFSDMVTLN